MADRLTVSTSELISASDRFVRQKEKLEGTCAEIAGIVQGSLNFWHGAANDAFIQKFSVMSGQLQQTSDKMQDAVDELLKAAGIFEESETRIRANAQALDTGSSPFLE